MGADLAVRLLAIMATVALGWLAARAGWLGRAVPADASGRPGLDPVQVLGNAAFYLFVPALLFRTVARLDLASLPGPTLAAYYLPVVAYALALYGWQRWRRPGQAASDAGGAIAAEPAARTVSATYGNGVQLGIPMAAAMFGEAGLALHIALVSVHALVLLSLFTTLVESDLTRARADPAGSALQARWHTLRSTVRNTVIHPVVLPVLAGGAWNLTGLGLHPVVDQTLQGLGSAVVPLCLVLIGMSLASHGLRGGLREAVVLSLLKLLLMPALVLVTAHGVFGLGGLPLAVLVMMAALPVGNNALLFAQRYGVRQAEATLTIVLSTAAFGFTAAGWLWVLSRLGGALPQ